MRLSLFFVAMFLFIACNRSEVQSERSLIGKWQLTSYYVSPGGETTWKDADPAHASFLEFTSGGKMTFTDDSSVRTFSYTLSSDGKILATKDSITNTFNYTFEGNELTLNAPCIEPCIYKYKQTRMQFNDSN